MDQVVTNFARWREANSHRPTIRLTMSITVFLLKPTLRAMSRYDSPPACMPSSRLAVLSEGRCPAWRPCPGRSQAGLDPILDQIALKLGQPATMMCISRRSSPYDQRLG